MKHLFILLSAAAMITLYAPTSSNAQGVGIDVPGVGVRVGEPDRPRYRERRSEDRELRQRVVHSGQNCRTVTIRRDDGSVRKMRRCD